MRYASVCSGIEAATVAWHPLGWTPVAFSEIEKFPSAVLAHHYPDTPNLGDMTQHEQWPIGSGSVDLLVGGTPCQSFSVAGLRKGLADPRGNLALTYLAIADRLRPRWLVWENVPGVLSSSGGRDFGSFLGALAELGYGFAYRVLDAQYFGVAQRRRRVFLVGHASDWRRAAAVLLEQSCLSWHPAPSREAREAVAGTLGARTSSGGGFSTDFESAGGLQPVAIQGNLIGRDAGGPHGVGASDEGAMYTLTKADVHGVAVPIQDGRDIDKRQNGIGVGQNGDPAYTLDQTGSQAVAHPVPYDLFQITAPVNQRNRKPGDPCHTLARDNAAHAAVAIGFNPDQSAKTRSMGEREQQAPTLRAGAEAAVAFTRCDNGRDASVQVTPTMRCGSNYSAHLAVAQAMAVRRLTPVECERLQGFPDGYTAIPWRGKPAAECPDGPRYRALGNSMAVPCMRWIGQRIAQVDAIAV